jgi:signal transduction histidine kinase
MPKGGEITLKASLVVDDKDKKNKVHIVVVDNGPGIPRSAHKNIFHMFYSTKGSSGYGLWSARRYAQLNSGDLMLDEKFTKGAKFILTLPTPLGLSDTTKG